MKIHKYSIYILLSALVAVTSGCSAELNASNDEELPSPMTMIYSPDIPAEVTVCGETISLDREDMFERFDRELTSMAFAHGNTLAIIKRANRYFPAMSKILREEDIPEDFLYLACIESSLIPGARSGAGAAGFWQLMPATARELGLEVNDSVDQRYDLELSTRAACKFLKRAYSRYGSWANVIASYNGGMGRVSRELEGQGVDSSFDLFLNEETSRYLYRLMAMKTIMDHPQDFGFIIGANQLYYPVEYDIVEVTPPVKDWTAWARDNGLSYKELRDHNPWIRGKSMPAPKAVKGKAAEAKKYKVSVPRRASLTRAGRNPEPFNPNWVAR